MHLETPAPGVTLVEYRPVFVPGFCLLFVLIGLVSLASAIERVAVHEGDYDSGTYRVVLYTPSGVFPLSNAFTAGEQRVRAAAEAIEEVLTRSAQAAA